MSRRNAAGILWIVAAFLVANSLRAQTTPTLQEIKKSLICTCNCNMTVETCEGAMTCESAKKLSAEAKQLIAQGLDTKQVLATFVDRYGEHILSAPTKAGFNLAAWIMPFAAILVTGFAVVMILRRWATTPRKQDAATASLPQTTDPRYEKLVDAVLQNLD